ncbi:unnamed protein product [Mucor circinelloides]
MEEPLDVNDFGIMDEASLHLGAQIKLSINVPNVIHSSGHPLSGSSTSIIKSYQETSCAVFICHLLLSSHAILCAAYSQCNVKTTPIQNVIIYTSTINQAILLSMLLLFYTQDQAILLSMRSLTTVYKSIQIVYHLYKFKINLITYINTNKQ